MRRYVLGSLVGVASVILLGALMLPLRTHLSVSTPALVLVIPIVIGAVIGGFRAGLASVAAGFLVFDFLFVSPYNTLNVDTSEDWVALVVYAVVMLVVARIVDVLDSARIETRRGHEVMRQVSALSELLVGDQPVDDVLRTIVTRARTVFNVPGVSLLELEEGRLVVVASDGEPLSSEELHQLGPLSGVPVRVGTMVGSIEGLRTVALSSSGRPVGILAMRGTPLTESEGALLNTFANDAALALERAELREQALRTRILEETDRFRRGLLGAVSHDLRTPLATIKVASSTLANEPGSLSDDHANELYQLIDVETDRLTRLVTNLLEMTRIEAGVLNLHRSPSSLAELIEVAMDTMRSSSVSRQIDVDLPPDLPAVDVDPVLVEQALVNLLDNALRHAPERSVITVRGEQKGDHVVVSVADRGAGVPVEDRATIFDRFVQLSTGGRAGLGLTIVKTFIEAHGERVWYEEIEGGGARFAFSLPSATAAKGR